MSYVLEALKKAQAQREQGAVPGIHSVQAPYVLEDDAPNTHLKLMRWVLPVLLVMIALVLAWRLDVPATQKALLGIGQATLSQAPPVPAPLQTASEGIELVLTPAMLPPAVPLSSASEIQASPSAKEEPAAVPKKESRESIQRKQAAKQPSEARRVYWVSELPEAVRRELPTLVMNGGSYSSNPAQRLIIVNNQVFTEGSQPVPGVVVQRIQPSAAVLSFQGYWYRLGY